jgi:hypothetical protein
VVSPRPRGFVDNWTPLPATQLLVDQVQAVPAEYAQQLPLTLRQIFYRLVGAHGYEKTRSSRPGRDCQDRHRRAYPPGDL